MESNVDSGATLMPVSKPTVQNETRGVSPTPGTKDEPTLRYRKTPIFLLFIYLPTLIVPWVLICIMTKRPLGGGSSYYDQSGTHYINNAVGVLITQLLKSTNAVLAVPIISTLLAHAAIVYAMRRYHDQKLNVQQLFALADKGWSNYLLLWSAKSRGKGSCFLWLGALLILLGAVLQPLMSVLVSFETIAATSCIDIPIGGCSNLGPMVVGYDPEPADMPFVQRDLVMQDVLTRLVTVSDLEPQPNLWPINPDKSDFLNGYQKPPDRRMFASYAPDSGFNPEGFFVTALENGTNTGVLREHAVRLNSSVRCEPIQKVDIPSPCPGARPFEMNIERPGAGIQLSVCVPGNASQFPFTPSRHRQDTVEEFYFHFEGPYNLTGAVNRTNTTIYCNASTSRGYFELGNELNHYVYGPLLDRWPDPDDIMTNFNDFRNDIAYSRPTEEDPSASMSELDWLLPFGRSMVSPFNSFEDLKASSVPGPLMVSAEVLFGNYSFLRFIADTTTNMTSNQMYAGVCEHGSFPFSQVIGIYSGELPGSYCGDAVEIVLDSYDLDDRLSLMISSYARIFNNTVFVEYMLAISIYFANRAVLTKTVLGEGPLYAREIYSSPGLIMVRPTMATASLVVITVLIFLQTLGLVVIALFVYSVPTWASAFDAMEMARIGRAMSDGDLPPLGPVRFKDEERLAKIDALIGRVSESNLSSENEGESEIRRQGAELASGRIKLALGGQGLVTRKVLREKS